MTLTQAFAVALRYQRELAGMSQEEIAEAADLDRTYISQLERGLKSPTLTTLEKLSRCFDIPVQRLLHEPSGLSGPRFPDDYIVSGEDLLAVSRKGDSIAVPTSIFTSAINVAHEMIDDMYAMELNVAGVLGLRNLSAFVGELVAAAVIRTGKGQFAANPHQDGYPDLLLMDAFGRSAWDRLQERLEEKEPFSPFIGGGIEMKATCGNIPPPGAQIWEKIARPAFGETRIVGMNGYDWKAHHRNTNNLLGILWDFIEGRPRIAALFYSGDLVQEDWGNIVQPRDGGGRTTSVSVMKRSGISKMYRGWICTLAAGGYREFLNRKNREQIIPV